MSFETDYYTSYIKALLEGNEKLQAENERLLKAMETLFRDWELRQINLTVIRDFLNNTTKELK